MEKTVIFNQKAGKHLEVTIIAIPDWDGFEKLVNFVQKYYSVEIIEKYDGPGARKWILESKGHRINLVHDDGYGNYFIAQTKESEKIVYQIGKDLEARLKKIEE